MTRIEQGIRFDKANCIFIVKKGRGIIEISFLKKIKKINFGAKFKLKNSVSIFVISKNSPHFPDFAAPGVDQSSLVASGVAEFATSALMDDCFGVFIHVQQRIHPLCLIVWLRDDIFHCTRQRGAMRCGNPKKAIAFFALRAVKYCSLCVVSLRAKKKWRLLFFDSHTSQRLTSHYL